MSEDEDVDGVGEGGVEGPAEGDVGVWLCPVLAQWGGFWGFSSVRAVLTPLSAVPAPICEGLEPVCALSISDRAELLFVIIQEDGPVTVALGRPVTTLLESVSVVTEVGPVLIFYAYFHAYCGNDEGHDDPVNRDWIMVTKNGENERWNSSVVFGISCRAYPCSQSCVAEPRRSFSVRVAWGECRSSRRVRP